jgi:hypothetical protein
VSKWRLKIEKKFSNKHPDDLIVIEDKLDDLIIKL